MAGASAGAGLWGQPWFKTFVAGSGFMSDSYDLFVIDTVNNILKNLYGQTPDQKAAVSNSALIGSVLGQVFFGFAGDALGRRGCFIVTSTLIIGGALLSASCTIGGAVDIYTQLCIWRGILGFGVGGEYPLSATITSEGAQTASRGRSVAAVFAMQGVGKVLGALVNYLVIARGAAYVPGGISLDSAWRFALAFGAAPALLTVYFRWRLEESDIFKKRAAAASPFEAGGGGGAGGAFDARKQHARAAMRMLWEYRWTLLGTAGCWFLLDVTFYGQGLMNTTVVQQALTGGSSGKSSIDSLRDGALGALLVVLIAVPGYLFAYLTIDRMGRKKMQLMGFAMTAALFFLLAADYQGLRATSGGAAFVIVYGMTYLFSNWGANTSTFIIPSEAFPTRIRATAHGLSAAAGKIGATVGNTVLVFIYNLQCDGGNCLTPQSPGADAGVVNVMWCCLAVCLAGLALTVALTKETMHASLDDVDAGSRVEAAFELARKARELQPAPWCGPAPEEAPPDGAAVGGKVHGVGDAPVAVAVAPLRVGGGGGGDRGALLGAGAGVVTPNPLERAAAGSVGAVR